jgi:hypothetical protein
MILPIAELESTTTMSIPDRSTFENIYAGQPPREIGRPQKSLIDMGRCQIIPER